MFNAVKIFVDDNVTDPTIGVLLNNLKDQRTNFTNADYILHPSLVREEMGIPVTIDKVTHVNANSNKKTIIITLSDFEGGYRYHDNIILLRTSAKASKLAKNEFIMPYLWDCNNEPFEPLRAPGSPSIGFCGLVDDSRKKIITAFENTNSVNCAFIKREAFWGGKPHDQAIMADFWNNLKQNEFALTPRGAGNFSMRFYQALSIGRIPVLVDTDTPLPLSKLIPWKDIIVIEKTESHCVERVMELHKTGQVANMQQRCYNAYHDFLSPEVFLGQFLAYLGHSTSIRKKSIFQQIKNKVLSNKYYQC